jgi:hypothetical protein
MEHKVSLSMVIKNVLCSSEVIKQMFDLKDIQAKNCWNHSAQVKP